MQVQEAIDISRLHCGSPCIDKLAPEPAESHTSSLQHSQAGNSQVANSSKHLEISTSYCQVDNGSNVVWLEAMRPSIDWAHRYIHMSTMESKVLVHGSDPFYS